MYAIRSYYVMRTLKLPDGRLKVLVQAMSKARIKEFIRTEPSYQVSVEVIEDLEAIDVSVETEALMRSVREQTEKIMSLRGILSADLMMIINNIEEPGRLADLVGSNLRLKIEESQAILEESDPVERLKLVRITSYNVCYTKLLRFPDRRRPVWNLYLQLERSLFVAGTATAGCCRG